MDAAILRANHAELLEREPKLRQRDAAHKLGVSEAELVACNVGNGVTRLDITGDVLLAGLEPCGELLGITRNAHCVIEKTGIYQNVKSFGHVGQVVDEGIDLRFFPRHWKYSFALTLETRKGPRRCVQVFDATGASVHKIYATQSTELSAFEALITRHIAEDQSAGLTLGPAPAAKPTKPDSEVDVAALRKQWSELQDTHAFVFLLRDLGVTRTQALRLAGEEWAKRAGKSAHRNVLEWVSAESERNVMVFVGNRGNLQIHIGPIGRIADAHGFYNVLDRSFNLHLLEDGVAESWVVRKPTKDGIVTSLEAYDAEGEKVFMLFHKRKEGVPELPEWSELLAAQTQ